MLVDLTFQGLLLQFDSDALFGGRLHLLFGCQLAAHEVACEVFFFCGQADIQLFIERRYACAQAVYSLGKLRGLVL